MVVRTGRFSLPYPTSGDSVKPQSRDYVDLANAVEVALGDVADQAKPVPLYGTEDPKALPDEPRYFEVRSATVAQNLGMPTATTGIITQWHLGTITIQQWMVAEGQRQLWLRSRRAPRDWSAWELVAPYAGSGETAASSGMKRVPLAFSLPAAPAENTVDAGSSRWVRSWAHMPSRVRVHVSNRNPGNQVNGGANNLLGVKIGKADAAGAMSDMREVIPAGALPTDGTELVSSWVDSPAGDGDYLGITLGWTGGVSQQVMDSGGWTQVTDAGWDAPSVDGWMRKDVMPFYVWIEAEVPARAPVVAGLGDSITVGRATTDPVQDSWLAVYCREMGALPLFFAQSGSSMSHWGVTDPRWASYYPGVDFTPDVLVFALGQNNMLDGQTLAQQQQRFGNVRAAYSTMWPSVPVFLCGVTPSSSKSEEVAVVRRAFNDWLRTLPNGERGYFDFPAAVGDPTDSFLLPEFQGDTLHPNTAGHAAMAALLVDRPVSPMSLSDARMRALAV